jgi:hypothetical protein
MPIIFPLPRGRRKGRSSRERPCRLKATQSPAGILQGIRAGIRGARHTEVTVMDKGETARDRAFHRVGSAAAIGGVIAALVQTAIDPGIPGDPQLAIRTAAHSRLLASSRLLDMAAFLLMLVAVAVVADMFAETRARCWARVGLALYAVSACAGAIATMVIGALPDVAHDWADAPAGLKAGYVATFDALNEVSGGIFAVSWAALAVFALLYAKAMLQEGTFPRWLPWTSLGSAVATIAALVLGAGFQLDIAFALLVLGLLLSYLVIVTLGVRLWRSALAPQPPADRPDSALAASETPRKGA